MSMKGKAARIISTPTTQRSINGFESFRKKGSKLSLSARVVVRVMKMVMVLIINDDGSISWYDVFVLMVMPKVKMLVMTHPSILHYSPTHLGHRELFSGK